MEIEVTVRKKIHVAPCIKCGSEDIIISDCGYSSFNYGGGECRKCRSHVSEGVGCLPTKQELVGIWNSKNDLSVVLASEEKKLASLKIKVSVQQKEIASLKRRIRKQASPAH